MGNETDRYLNKREAAALLGVSVAWLNRRIVRREPQHPRKFGALRRYSYAELREWADQQRPEVKR
ncbi:MAG: helix-turn-helix domain-containing protein [Planctomycetes bacterium]|nr:helix-turn-helix domain-containing protein [Planctomycetota bacterium]